MAYRVKTRVHWAGRVLYAGDELTPFIPGRNYAAMEQRGEIEKVPDTGSTRHADEEPTTTKPKAARKRSTVTKPSE